jgi:hypothetical protein
MLAEMARKREEAERARAEQQARDREAAQPAAAEHARRSLTPD